MPSGPAHSTLREGRGGSGRTAHRRRYCAGERFRWVGQGGAGRLLGLCCVGCLHCLWESRVWDGMRLGAVDLHGGWWDAWALPWGWVLDGCGPAAPCCKGGCGLGWVGGICASFGACVRRRPARPVLQGRGASESTAPLGQDLYRGWGVWVVLVGWELYWGILCGGEEWLTAARARCQQTWVMGGGRDPGLACDWFACRRQLISNCTRVQLLAVGVGGSSGVGWWCGQAWSWDAWKLELWIGRP